MFDENVFKIYLWVGLHIQGESKKTDSFEMQIIALNPFGTKHINKCTLN